MSSYSYRFAWTQFPWTLMTLTIIIIILYTSTKRITRLYVGVYLTRHLSTHVDSKRNSTYIRFSFFFILNKIIYLGLMSIVRVRYESFVCTRIMGRKKINSNLFIFNLLKFVFLHSNNTAVSGIIFFINYYV